MPARNTQQPRGPSRGQPLVRSISLQPTTANEDDTPQPRQTAPVPTSTPLNPSIQIENETQPYSYSTPLQAIQAIQQKTILQIKQDIQDILSRLMTTTTTNDLTGEETKLIETIRKYRVVDKIELNALSEAFGDVVIPLQTTNPAGFHAI